MGRHVVRQPDGKWAIFSSVCDDFLYIHATASDIINWFLDEERRNLECGLKIELDEAENNGVIDTKSFDECIQTIKHVHGKNSRTLREFKIK